MISRKSYLIVMLAGLLLPLGAKAQPAWVDEDYVVEELPFLDSRNPAGLYVLDIPELTQVELYWNKTNGKLVNYYESDNSFRIFAGAHSLYRFSPSIVMRGAISYQNEQGRDRSGSVFLDPYYNPFDLLEMTDKDKGLKKEEKYHVRTDLSWQVYKGLALGASFDFVSANLSKMKDLRHSNVYSDLKLDLGLSYDFKGKFAIGAAWNFRKSVEGISFERFSSGDLHYEILVSYGPFWGKRKSFEENTGQISKTRIPVKNIFQGGSLQLEIKPLPQFSLFLEGNCAYRTCEYGHRSPNTVLYNTFDGLEYGASVQALFKADTHRHLLSFDFSGRPMTSYESVYKIVHYESGENETQYFDPKQVSESDLRLYAVSYRADFMKGQTGRNMPAGTFKASMKVYERSRLTTIYPYYRQEYLLPFVCHLEGQGNIPLQKNLFSVGLGLSYAGQLVDEYVEGSFIPDPTQLYPKSAPQMQNWEHEYLTCPKLALSPSFRYSRQISKFVLWAELRYSWEKALVPLEYLAGDDLHSVRVSLGLSF